MILRKGIIALVAGLVFATPAIAQQETVLGEGESITISVDPSYLDTTFVFDTTFVQDTIPLECALSGWTCTPPDTTIVPEPDPVDPPGTVRGLRLSQVDSAIVVTWSGADGATSFLVEGGENTGSWRFPQQGTFIGNTASMIPRASGSHWVCVWGQNDTAASADGACKPIVFTMPNPPPVQLTYLLSISANRYEMTGMQDVVEGDYYIHLDRPDGAWLGQGDISMPGVDSVIFVLDGFRNREQRYPYEATGDVVTMPVGAHTVIWEVYGDEPETGQASFTVISDGVDPDPPVPPSGNIITQHTFTQRLEDGWTEHQPPSGWYSIGIDSGETYGQALYTPSLCVGCGPIKVRRGFDDIDELTVELRWQLSPNFEHNTGSTNKKIFFLEAHSEGTGENGPNPIILGAKADGRFYLNLQRTAEQPGGSRIATGGQWEPGRIYDVKLYIKLNSVDTNGNSNPDGIGTVWVDGTRVLHATDYRFRGDDSPQVSTGKWFKSSWGITGIRWNPTWPNGGDSPAENMWERIYNFTVFSGFEE